MKRLLILLLLVACSHEHKHEHVIHGVIDDLNTAYIMRVDPSPTQWGIPPIGVLTKQIGENENAREIVEIQFSRYPENYDVVDLHLPWLDTTPIGTKGLSSGTIHKAIITTRCHDPEHTGYIAFRATWDTSHALPASTEVDFVYKCPKRT